MLSRIVKTGTFALEVKRRFFVNRKDDKKVNAEWLKREMQAMGPTYIKIGQFMSSRSDIFDKDIVDVLRSLQDDVDPAPQVATKVFITERLSEYMGYIKEIKLDPIACASIGQVHTVTLNSGKTLAVKIRRPGVCADLDMDIMILYTFLNFLELMNAENVKETKELLLDFKRWFTDETSYSTELSNYRLLQDSLSGTNNIRLPKFYKDMCRDDMLIMAYLPSKKLRDVKNTLTTKRRREISLELMDTFVGQLVTSGVIHGDPHEGNIGLADDMKTIVLYDMGNVIRIDLSVRKSLKYLMFEIVQGNIDEAMAAMYKMPIFEIRDESKVRALLIAYADYMKKVDVQVLVETMNNGSMRGDLAIKFAPIVFRVIRVFSLLEGICKDLDPEFNYDKVFAKYMQVMDSEYVGYKVNSDIKRVAKLLLKNLD